MQATAPLALSFVTGVVSGFLLSLPVGPINLTVINDAARHGFLHAWLVGLGAVTMDIVYCSIGLAGFSGLFASAWMRATMELISFMLLLFLGWKYLSARTIPATSRAADAMEQRFHPHTAYMTGLVRGLGNPGVLVLWLTVSAAFVAHQWVVPDLAGKALCVAGVGVGATAWFGLLSYGVSRGHGRFSERTLLWVSHISGGLLLLGASIIAVRIVRLLARH